MTAFLSILFPAELSVWIAFSAVRNDSAVLGNGQVTPQLARDHAVR